MVRRWKQMNRRRRKLTGDPASPAQQRSGLLHDEMDPMLFWMQPD